MTRLLSAALAAKRGLNPDVWLNNVEVLAAQKIGAETVTYVSNIYKYYIAYKLEAELQAERQKEREELRKAGLVKPASLPRSRTNVQYRPRRRAIIVADYSPTLEQAHDCRTISCPAGGAGRRRAGVCAVRKPRA